MKIDILTLFPHMFEGVFEHSIIGRAKEKNLADIQTHDLREFGEGERKTVDDRPYGGGVGMILRVDIIDAAISNLSHFAKASRDGPKSKTILLSPSGRRFTQKKAQEYSKLNHIILICGRYEGFDERIAENLVDEEISIGDYVLTGGEIPAMVVTDSVVRLIPGVVPKEEATQFESFSDPNLVEYPQYTRPDEFKGWSVPEILKNGDHKKINEWRTLKSIEKTKKNRPDLVGDRND